MPNELPTFNALMDSIRGRKVLVFGGFSALGYANPEKLREDIDNILRHESNQGAVVVVSGASHEGIGVVYEIAKNLHLETYGIISEEGRNIKLDPHCEHILFVADPQKTWQTKDASGKSLMISVAKDNGDIYYFGGGDVAVAEIKEARSHGLKPFIDASYDPNPENLAAKQARAPYGTKIDPTPVRTYTKEAARENLLANLEDELNRPDLNEEQKYDLIFEDFKPLFKRLGIDPDYYDPDTSYAEDTAAYLKALREAIHPPKAPEIEL